MHFCIFNGPPRSGKSTTARDVAIRLRNKGLTVVSDSFAAPMKDFVAKLLGEKYQEMDKEKARAELNGYSARDFLITLSEHHIKPRYGVDAFGRWLYHRAMRNNPLPDWVVVDDSGFIGEREVLGGNVVLVQMRRPGFDFSGDSRGYLPDPDWVINNDGDDGMRVASAIALVEELAKVDLGREYYGP